MTKQRKILCDCGVMLEKQKAAFDHIKTEAMICPQCKFTTLTKEQAKKYVRSKLFSLNKLFLLP
ncbi:hypothetical protein HYY69_07860 [Candidatus Woesearchaeota archaeon]|nr:hypothetical protein [Candidatus Woesearchaeota archaeon]